MDISGFPPVPTGPWTSYTPAVTVTSGAITALGAVSGRYQTTGKRLDLSVSVAVTTNGTAGGLFNIALPPPFVAAAASVLAGRETNTTGAMLQGIIANGANTITTLTSTNVYPAGNGCILVLSGSIEIQ